jgi:hypothetical protein
MIRFLAAFALMCLVVPSTAAAGTVVEFELFAYDPTMEGGTGTMYFEKNLARIETKSKTRTQITIYRPDEEIMWHISPDELKYSVLTPKKVKKVRAKLMDQLEQIDERLHSMTKEERERIQKERGAMLHGMRELTEERSHKDIAIEKIEGGVTIGAYTCDKYRMLFKGKFDDAECWIADWTQVGANRDDFSVCARTEQQFGVFAGELALLAVLWSDEVKSPVDGLPVRVVSYNEGSKSIRVDVTAVRHEDLDPKLFELPPNYDETPFMGIE